MNARRDVISNLTWENRGITVDIASIQNESVLANTDGDSDFVYHIAAARYVWESMDRTLVGVQLNIVCLLLAVKGRDRVVPVAEATIVYWW